MLTVTRTFAWGVLTSSYRVMYSACAAAVSCRGCHCLVSLLTSLHAPSVARGASASVASATQQALQTIGCGSQHQTLAGAHVAAEQHQHGAHTPEWQAGNPVTRVTTIVYHQHILDRHKRNISSKSSLSAAAQHKPTGLRSARSNRESRTISRQGWMCQQVSLLHLCGVRSPGEQHNAQWRLARWSC